METLGVFVGTSWGEPRMLPGAGGAWAWGQKRWVPRWHRAVQGHGGEPAVAQPEVNHSTPRQVG